MTDAIEILYTSFDSLAQFGEQVQFLLFTDSQISCIAFAAVSLRIVHAIGVCTLGSQLFSTFQIVAIIAHAFGVVLLVRMWTLRNVPGLSLLQRDLCILTRGICVALVLSFLTCDFRLLTDRVIFIILI